MVKNIKLIKVFLLILLFISGCTVYSGGHSSGDLCFNREKAMQENLQLHAKYDLTEIFPLKSPIQKTALIAIPSREPFEGNSVKAMGRVGNVGKFKLRKVNLSQKEVEYINAVSQENYEFVYKAIQKRNLFNKTNLVRNDSPENTPHDEYDYLIYYHRPVTDALDGWTIITGIGKAIYASAIPLANWYVKSKDCSEPRPINVFSRRFTNSPRGFFSYNSINIWLKYLEELVSEPIPARTSNNNP